MNGWRLDASHGLLRFFGISLGGTKSGYCRGEGPRGGAVTSLSVVIPLAPGSARSARLVVLQFRFDGRRRWCLPCAALCSPSSRVLCLWLCAGTNLVRWHACVLFDAHATKKKPLPTSNAKRNRVAKIKRKIRN